MCFNAEQIVANPYRVFNGDESIEREHLEFNCICRKRALPASSRGAFLAGSEESAYWDVPAARHGSSDDKRRFRQFAELNEKQNGPSPDLFAGTHES
jgi:hypothetical protein